MATKDEKISWATLGVGALIGAVAGVLGLAWASSCVADDIRSWFPRDVPPTQQPGNNGKTAGDI